MDLIFITIIMVGCVLLLFLAIMMASGRSIGGTVRPLSKRNQPVKVYQVPRTSNHQNNQPVIYQQAQVPQYQAQVQSYQQPQKRKVHVQPRLLGRGSNNSQPISGFGAVNGNGPAVKLW